ncbi:MAG: hypothetical protein ACK57V_15795 [Pirellula sp.]|jgi:hypothetical protein
MEITSGGKQLHITRGEVLTWITEWVEDFGVEWRECPLNILDKKAGLTSDLKTLLKEDRVLRLAILEKPVPKSLIVDMDFFQLYRRSIVLRRRASIA